MRCVRSLPGSGIAAWIPSSPGRARHVHQRTCVHTAVRNVAARIVVRPAWRIAQEPDRDAGLDRPLHSCGSKLGMDYLIVKWVHILSSTLLFGTGLGIAFFMWMAHR